jgi:hypothetical protein
MIRADEKDIAWFAGFYEGEGSCHKHGSGIRIQLYQKDRWPIDKAIALFGGRIHATSASSRTNAGFIYQLPNQEGADLLFAILPHLSPRRQEQILPVLEHWVTRLERRGF